MIDLWHFDILNENYIPMQLQMIELHSEIYAPFFTHLSCYSNTEIWGIKFSV